MIGGQISQALKHSRFYEGNVSIYIFFLKKLRKLSYVNNLAFYLDDSKQALDNLDNFRKKIMDDEFRIREKKRIRYASRK